jgi:hypothetical protein
MLSKTMLITVLTTVTIVYALGLILFLFLRVAFGGGWRC